MATLTDDQKLHIVQCLACFDTPDEAARSVSEEFGISVARMQAQAYDPNKAAARHLAKKWREIFAATRKAFLEGTAMIPIAKQAYRLRTLQTLMEQARGRRNVPLAAALLEQAAKETGGMYTNRRELTGAGGGPIHTKSDVVHDLSDEDLARVAALGLPAAAAAK